MKKSNKKSSTAIKFYLVDKYCICILTTVTITININIVYRSDQHALTKI